MPTPTAPPSRHGPVGPVLGIRDVDLGMTHTADVVVCDRDDVVALLTAEVLRGAGWRVHVRDLADLLADPATAPVLLIGDPTTAGPAEEALTALRRQPTGMHPTIVAVTESPDPDVTAELLDAGADQVLIRPWSPRLLRATAAATLRRHHLTCGATPDVDADT